MANKIIISLYNDPSNSYISPLTEDIQFQLQTQFGTMGDGLGRIGSMISTVAQVQSALSGSLSPGISTLNNMVDLPRWKSTDPLKINVKMHFYTKTDPYLDVIVPTRLLSTLSILSVDYTKNPPQIITPGASVKYLSKVNAEGTTQQTTLKPKKKIEKLTEKEFESGSKLISVEIPGIVYLSVAYVESAIPTYSKHITSSGYPLWADVDLQISSFTPATDYMFWNADSTLNFLAVQAGLL